MSYVGKATRNSSKMQYYTLSSQVSTIPISLPLVLIKEFCVLHIAINYVLHLLLRWRAGPWGVCSVTCGSGNRLRDVECVQEITPSLVMRIADGACTEPNILPTTEICEMPQCEFDTKAATTTLPPPQWSVGTWSSVSFYFTQSFEKLPD